MRISRYRNLFSRHQLKCNWVKRGFLLGANDTASILNEVDAEHGPTSYGKERYGQEELYWLGYLYRYWAYTYEKTANRCISK